MKSLIAVSLFAISLTSFAGVSRMIGTGECSALIPTSASVDAKKAELTKCAESRAHSNLSQKCEGRGTGWLLESEIAKRDFKVQVGPEGRNISVSAMAVGRCEF